MELEEAAAQLEALGNPTRLKVYRALVRAGDGGMPVGRLQQRIGIAASTLSHHLHKLITVGLVTQERQVTTLIRQGLPTREVAAQMFVSPRTVDFHLRNVFAKLGVTSRAELAHASLG